MSLIETYLRDRNIKYKKNQPLSEYTTLRIGGIAKLIVFPKEKDILELLEVIKNEGARYFIIGGGSNLLISDRGYDGVIINTKEMNSINLNNGLLTVSAGVSLARAVIFSVKRGLAGLEGLIGIPGTVGGALFGNAGSFGYEIKDCLQDVDFVDENLKLKTLKASELNFTYRSSGLPPNSLIVSARFKLTRDNQNLLERIKEFIEKKRETQPMRELSAGCVFKNPEGISAGYLIDKAGLKGMRTGDIMISSVHANYFINVGKGTASDFLKLMELVKERVFKVFGVELKPEIRILEA